MNNQKMELGKILITIKALNTFTKEEINESLTKYKELNFGAISDTEYKNNKVAVAYKGLIIGRYKLNEGTMLIYTAWDRSITTICLDNEF